MPPKPTGASVTTRTCGCEYLMQQAAEPGTPITFDSAAGEYRIATRRGGYLVILHCPWCGGVAPRTPVEQPFETVTWAEVRRLDRLTSTVRSVTQALSSFGHPAKDRKRGITVKMPATATTPETTESFRTLLFDKLSQTANVVLADYGPRGVKFHYEPKLRRKGRRGPTKR
jgi:hypothetical protein